MTASDMTSAQQAVESTLMFQEAAEAGAAVARFLAANAAAIDGLVRRLREAPPHVITTCARGSSDHAATFGKYLFETFLGIPTASAAPSISSIYGATPAGTANGLCIAISQSGRSLDLLASVAAQKAAGYYVVAFVNDETSPLANAADVVLGLNAGPEKSVAATKSYITSLAGLAALVAAWVDDASLKQAVQALPERLEQAFAHDWNGAVAALKDVRNLFVVGRGFTFAIAQEAALKCKETCGLHAEAYSAAEVKHGPMAIVQEGFPILAFAGSDAAGDDVCETASLFADRGAVVQLAASGAGDSGNLPAMTAEPMIEPILMIQSFYRMVNALSVARGFDPDSPPYLKKVTSTR